MPLKRIPINENWEFKQETSLNNNTAKDFLPVAQFPTVAHIDLLHHNLIKDPYIDTNELDSLWVNDADWTYRTTLPSINLADSTSRASLIFDGLDTIVSVYLNGEEILESTNMHLSHRVDITSILQETNTLELKFKNAPEYAKTEMKRIGWRGNPKTISFGGPERLFVRKAQYHWGWDWGPALNTSGPWKEVWLETWEEGGRIDEFIVRQEVAADLHSAALKVSGLVDGTAASVQVTLGKPDGSEYLKTDIIVKDGVFEAELQLQQGLELWYPFTYGAQPLYTVRATIPNQHEQVRRIGFRRLRLLQHSLKEQDGTSFLFEINNIRTFLGGSCWIPADYLLPRVTTKTYYDWLSLAKSGNQGMIRVWGGGLVEHNDFFTACDELGIVVWQDFLFACGNYPASPEFIASVKIEAEQQVKRVGHHASLVIWAGNNEDYMLAELRGWEYDIKDQKGPWDKTNFPAREIYERTLPEICERLAGDVPYWRSSPYGGKFANDTTVGDTHIWDVWHGPMAPYQDYAKFSSRFVTEFGFESAASIRTLHKGITKPSERHWQSLTFDAHDKGPGHKRRYGMYSGENFRFRFNPFRDFIYSTQFLQAEAMKYAYNHWRRQFRGPDREYCAGILVWQLNDIWPATSWALVDVDWNRKPSFYITKRALAKVVVGMERVVTGRVGYMVTSYPEQKNRVEIWAVNGHLEPIKGILKLEAFDIESGKKLALPENETQRSIELSPNQTTELTSLEIPKADTTALAAYIIDSKTGEQLARWVSWPEPLKFVHFSKNQQVKIDVQSDGEQVTISADAPVKGVVVGVPIEEGGDDAVFEDNFVDLVPGEAVKLKVTGLANRKLEARWLCDWENEPNFKL